MKKLSYIVCSALMAAGTMLTSCGDNKDFCSEHVLTTDELAEMRRQDSIREAQRNMINADLILEYNVEFFISANSYDGAEVNIDIDKIASFFGLDVDQMCADLDEGTGDVVPFAIEGSTHADNMGGSTSGTYWGHWWNADGNVCNWGEDAMIFTEFYGENRILNVGQYPGHLTAGVPVKVIEALKYGDKRIAVVLNVIPQERGEVVATVVGTSEVSIALPPQGDYSSNPLALPVDEICAKLGIGSMADAQFLALNADGSYCQETDDGWGFWMDKEGYKGGWGENASVMVGWDAGSSELGILEMPDGLAVGESVVAHLAFVAGNKIQLVNVTVNIEAYQDPETAPEGDPVSIERDLNLSIAYNTDYAAVDEDVQEELRQAFKMTTYQIFSALNSGEMKVYLDEVSEEDPAYTAGTGEYWLTAEGKSCEWADGIAYGGLFATETSLVLEAGHHPENVSPAEKTEVKVNFVVACKGVTATYHVTFTVTPQE